MQKPIHAAESRHWTDSLKSGFSNRTRWYYKQKMSSRPQISLSLISLIRPNWARTEG
jgi:hypothetical protein